MSQEFYSGLTLFKNKKDATPAIAESEVLKIKLPMIYCSRLFFISSKFKSWLKISLSPLTNGAPRNREAAIIKGIKGGRLTLEATNASTLLSLKNTDKLITKSV